MKQLHLSDLSEVMVPVNALLKCPRGISPPKNLLINSFGLVQSLVQKQPLSMLKM